MIQRLHSPRNFETKALSLPHTRHLVIALAPAQFWVLAALMCSKAIQYEKQELYRALCPLYYKSTLAAIVMQGFSSDFADAEIDGTGDTAIIGTGRPVLSSALELSPGRDASFCLPARSMSAQKLGRQQVDWICTIQ